MALHMNVAAQVAIGHTVRSLHSLIQWRTNGAHQPDARDHRQHQCHHRGQNQHHDCAVIHLARSLGLGARHVTVVFDELVQRGRRLVVELERLARHELLGLVLFAIVRELEQLSIQLHVALALLDELVIKVTLFLGDDQRLIQLLVLCQTALKLGELLFHLVQIGGLGVVDVTQLQQARTHQLRAHGVDDFHTGQCIACDGFGVATHGAQLHQGDAHNNNQQQHQNTDGSQYACGDFDVLHKSSAPLYFLKFSRMFCLKQKTFMVLTF